MKKSGTGKHCTTTVTPAKNMTYFSDMEFICYDILKNTATIVKERRFDYYGLQFVRSGEIKVMFDDGSSWQTKGPVLFLTGPGKEFTYFSPNGTRDHIYICFRGDRAQRYLEGGLMPGVFGEKIVITNEKEFFSIMEQTIRKLKKHSEISFGEAVLLLEKTLLLIRNQPPQRKIDAFNHQIINEFAEKISENPELDWNIEEFADSHNLSEVHFRRLFRKKIGVPPNQYILRQRIRQAAHLLQTTDMLIKEIAFACGFGGEFYFSRQFTKIMKQTPTDFRKISI